MSKALVLGGKSGLLGQALVKVLNERDWEVQSFGRQDGDLSDPDYVERLLGEANADAVFNSLAWTRVDDAEDHQNEADQANRILPSILAKAMARLGHGFLAHFSTDFVFPGDSTIPYPENAPPDPKNVYGSTKLAGEKAVLAALPERSCVIRTAWLFGPGRKNFITSILDACNKRDMISVVDDQIGSPTYSLDLALWSTTLAEKKAAGIWNGVNSGHASWCEFAAEAVALVRGPCKVEPIPSAQWPQKAIRPPYSVLNNEKLAAVIGKKPRPWPQALRDYIFGYILPDKEDNLEKH